ncbi:MAG: FAD-binding oxidoreductase [Planctomycetaceae bacterium]|nr:FAD-binding oxidoreductase [Planctomycetaceae bacterium]
MPENLKLLPSTDTIEPASSTEIAAQLLECYEQSMAVYPVGGQTALDYGLPATTVGIAVSTKAIDQVIDFPVRDLTITVEAGMPMQRLSNLLEAEGLMLPLDVPQASQATLGGVIATNTNGPRRFGLGTVRDYVIGIEAVDGRGQLFHGGGRVVKNVAGYDFCKLLTGSLGTLGVITAATVKVKPISEQTTTVVAVVPNGHSGEAAIASMLISEAMPVAVQWLQGECWQQLCGGGSKTTGKSIMAIQLAGTTVEVDWSQATVLRELKTAGLTNGSILDPTQQQALWSAICEFPANDAELVIQVKTVSSGVVEIIAKCCELNSDCVIQAAAGDGVVTVAFEQLPTEGISSTLIAELAPLAARFHGNVVTLKNPQAAALTAGSMWGRLSAPLSIMQSVKEQFDPHGILNPGRFIFK